MTEAQFPEITGCIICELVRKESRGKNSILGLFGMTPRVEILGNIKNPLENFSLFFLGGPGGGEFILQFLLVDPDGNNFINKETTIKFHTGTYFHMNLHLQNLQFPSYGEYSIKIYANGELKFDSVFKVLKEKDN